MCTHTEESSHGSIEAEICWPLYSWCAAVAQQDAAGDSQSPPPSITETHNNKTQNPPTQEPQFSPNPKRIPKLQNGDTPHSACHHRPPPSNLVQISSLPNHNYANHLHSKKFPCFTFAAGFREMMAYYELDLTYA